MIYCFEIRGKLFQIIIVYILERITQHMNDTSLDFCLRIDCLYGFFKARKPVYTKEKYILYSAILQIVEHSKPELAGFIGSHCDAEDIFVPFHRNTKNNISSTA